MPTINPQDEIDEVRLNCGSPGENNLSDADIDSALSSADDETTERTGLLPTDNRLPNMRRKMKLLLATSYLLIRFSGQDKNRDSIVREVERMTNNMKILETTDTDDETLTDTIDDDEYSQGLQMNYWRDGTRRTLPIRFRGRTVYGNNTEFWITRIEH